MAAAPLCVLPAKDVVEELFWKKEGMTKKINVLVTCGLVTMCFIMALFIPGIGDAMTIAGCTTNPMVRILSDHFLEWIHPTNHLLLEGSREKTIGLQRKANSIGSSNHHCHTFNPQFY